jgi:hypothetical protein
VVYGYEIVWEYDCGCFSKYFLLGNASKYNFFIFKKLFLISAYQNDFKTPQNINLKKN